MSIIMRGRSCVLGDMQEEYLSLHTTYLNDPEVNRYLLSRPPFTIDQQRKWLEGRRRAGDQVLAVFVPESREGDEQLIFIGVMDLRGVDRSRKTASSGSVIGDKRYWGRGIAREARLMQLKLAFDTLGLEQIFSTTVRPNVRSQRLLESTGYQLIACHPKTRLVDGFFHDELVYRVSRSLWLPHWVCYPEA